MALANVECGARLFPVTVTMDDPGVADDVATPAMSYQHFGNAAAKLADHAPAEDEFVLG